MLLPFCRFCYIDVAAVVVWLVDEYSIVVNTVVGKLLISHFAVEEALLNVGDNR